MTMPARGKNISDTVRIADSLSHKSPRRPD
jgi:hypothetical protein